ncbi:MAG: YidC/Oxa1 family membrane protein insertase [Candidatus Peribacteraceae bacterium]|nr:YidC/Oxa1 family membrane protein insertase [Candidatus Peribacteraceae bacterium]
MPAEPTKSKSSKIEFLLTFGIIFLLANFGFKYFFPDQGKVLPPVVLSMEKAGVAQGNDPVVFIRNNTDKDLPLPARCPQPPVNIAFVTLKADGSEEKADLMANASVLPCLELSVVPAQEKVRVPLAGWKYALFEQNGTYEISLDLPEGFVAEGASDRVVTTFRMTEPGFFTKLFRTFIFEPLFNALLFIGSWLPGRNLGLAIILLTVLVKLILLIPNQHALEGQRKLQLLQPRMEEIKRKFPDDSKRVQEETMKLWKEMKINPLQSCLPTLLQLPILIGLFYVIRDGVSIETSRHLIYSFYSELPSPFFVNTFLGLDLLTPNLWLMPPLLVVLQFIQMKMMMQKPKSKTDEIVVQPVGKRFQMPKMDQQTIMLYVMPLMIGFFAIKFPSAVSMYWGASTLFGIAQQWYVMREKMKV